MLSPLPPLCLVARLLGYLHDALNPVGAGRNLFFAYQLDLTLNAQVWKGEVILLLLRRLPLLSTVSCSQLSYHSSVVLTLSALKMYGLLCDVIMTVWPFRGLCPSIEDRAFFTSQSSPTTVDCCCAMLWCAVLCVLLV